MNKTVQIFDIEKIKISKNYKIQSVIIRISSMEEFTKFYKAIDHEIFLYSGHFLILAENEIFMEKIFSEFWKIWIFNVNIL
jgi:hypothetical protein